MNAPVIIRTYGVPNPNPPHKIYPIISNAVPITIVRKRYKHINSDFVNFMIIYNVFD